MRGEEGERKGKGMEREKVLFLLYRIPFIETTYTR